ncbi:MAG: hypothetical protein L0170_17500, partial [Acidobacteria bacterium]|nr:hypothetical protein [Acidobacteriota bacterium]
GTTVQGTLHSLPNFNFIVDLFANDSCDASGNGEGQYYLGSSAANTDVSGNASFFGSFPVTLSPGQVVTGTASIGAPGGDTSEFSVCFPGFINRPGEVLNLNWTAGSTTSLEWSPVAGASTYALFRGTQVELLNLAHEGVDSCFRAETAGTTTGAGSLAEIPAIGSLQWYVARAANGAGDGPAGNASSGPRVHDSAVVCSSSCGHDKCALGVALAAGCEPCVSRICTVDPYCCNTLWDEFCVAEVRTICRHLRCSEGQGTCTHGLCTGGPALVAGCDTAAPSTSCVQQVCAADPFCCDGATGSWDAICVHEVDSICGKRCF